ncbi:MAG: dockerin type I domain-containing protein [Verrucomicrobiota bacterium]|nr:dockerin type I domain-containing protein [Verrucomicrobiota bacterium]
MACLLGSAIDPHRAIAARINQPTLTFAQRVTYQRAIEQVYWRHRTWPKENRGAKPSLDKVVSPQQIAKNVEDYLRKSQTLEDYWQRPISAEQLQSEMDRMARQTQQSEVLRELFEALGNDPFVIAECLARPALAERLLSSWYANDQRIHRELRQRAEADLRMHQRVEQMKQLSGEYSEIELFRSDSGEPQENRGGVNPSRKLSSGEWNDVLQKLTALFSRPGAETDELPAGQLTPLAEDEMRYYTTAVVEKSEERLKLATITWRKESLESWLADAEHEMPTVIVAPLAAYTLPPISEEAGGCANDSWMATAIQGTGRDRHTAVWTGSEMIVWGGEVALNVFSNTGARYNPSTDSWAATSTVNAPSNRADLSVVWTGTEMILWGGDTPGVYFNSGGRYNPASDSWTPTSVANAPHARENQTAVWSGSEMIIWGGYYYDGSDHYVNTGGRYNPATDSWIPTSIANAPDGRDTHTAIWTGTEMVVWGGAIANSQWVNTGGRYNATTDTWAPTSIANAPSARAEHTAVWTGSEMIVWGGFTFSSQTNTGGRYNPSADSWTATSTTNAPTRRYDHPAIWTGYEMIVWGGFGCTDQSCQTTTYLNTGARYSPSTNGWVATTMTNAPSARGGHTAIWTGNEMIVWGGFFGNNSYLNTGGRYCAQPSTPLVQSAVSRKTHGNAGSFDLNLPLTGTPGIECRSGGASGDYTIVLTFLANVSVSGIPQAAVTSGSGMIGSGGVSNGGTVTTSGNVVIIPLTNVANAQTINVTLNNVNGATNLTIPMAVLLGDTNGDGFVNSGDALQTRNRAGQTTDAANFRSDVNADGFVNSGDSTIVRARSGTALP